MPTSMRHHFLIKNEFQKHKKMRRFLLSLMLCVMLSSVAFAQQVTVKSSKDLTNPAETVKKDTCYWTHKGNIGFNLSQSAYVNWSAGGQNALNLLGTFYYEINYAKDKWKWDNSFNTALGYSFYSFKFKQFKPIKTDDKIELTSLAGYKITDKLFASLELAFRTQYARGYDYAKDSSTYISKFLAPAYLTLGLGIEWKPNEHFSLNFAPITGRMVIVNDSTLAAQGAFGVNEIDPNDTTSHSINKVHFELGARLTAKLKYTIVKNVDFESKLELFSNYLPRKYGHYEEGTWIDEGRHSRPWLIDVDWQNMLIFKVNDWLNCNLSTHLVYDYDIPFYRDPADQTTLIKGSKVQFKEVFAVGLMFNLK